MRSQQFISSALGVLLEVSLKVLGFLYDYSQATNVTYI
jgi:hypothetical protein